MTAPKTRSDSDDDAAAALRRALEQLMTPIARLCLARGLSFAAAEELLKRAYVGAAREAHPAGAGRRDVSRVSTATGLSRREVTRISNGAGARQAVRPSPATQVFTRWMGDTRLHDEHGEPRPLKRQGPAPSFEALAHSVTRDVHPRSILDELCRLGLAALDENSDSVRLLRDAFVPSQDQVRMLGFLGSNAGDHLATAVANVTGDGTPQLEQAIFADELSDESLSEVRKLVGAQWKTMLADLVPRLEALIEADRRDGRAARKRVRIGLYSHQAAMDEPDEDPKDS